MLTSCDEYVRILDVRHDQGSTNVDAPFDQIDAEHKAVGWIHKRDAELYSLHMHTLRQRLQITNFN